MERPKFRNLALAAALALSPSVIVDCNRPQSTESPSPSAAIIAEPNSPQYPDTIIMNEIKKTHPNPDSDEILHWQDAYKYNGNTSLGLSFNEMVLKAEDRVIETLDTMAESKNDKISYAWKYLTTIRDSRSMKLGFVDDPTGSLNILADFSTGILIPELDFSNQLVLDHSSALTLALQLTNANNTLMQMIAYADSLPDNLSATQKQAKLLEFNSNINLIAQSYGVESEAAIIQDGLMGKVITVEGSGEEERDAEYIDTGRNAQKPEWISYIAQLVSQPTQ